jgi:hypothetical protein
MPSGPIRLLLVLLTASACAAHVTGIVEASDGATSLRSMGGRKVPLWLDADGKPLNDLDGYTVEVWGRRAVGPLRVDRWSVVEGTLPAWAGVLERRGVQLGLLDRGSQAFYFIGDVPELEPHLGELVVVEGYVDGPHRVTVTAFRVLAR